MTSDLEHAYVDLCEVRLHYVQAGEGPLVVLLHGFPDFWFSWKSQISTLAEAGYRVIAPDMRGYNLSDKPPGVTAYRTDKLARDVSELIEALGDGPARAVVGHDWGGGVAWYFAMAYPEMAERLGILNCPHPSRMARAVTNPVQLRRSWYIGFFQLPVLPEMAIRRNDYDAIRQLFSKAPRNRDALSPEDVETHVRAVAQPGALTSMINYYRANFRQNPMRVAQTSPTIELPTLVIWGDQDLALGRELAEPDPKWVPNAHVEHIPEASHWPHLDAPETVSELLIAFFEQALVHP